MKVEIEISEKSFNLVVTQCMVMADSKEDEQSVKKAEERCKEATVKINPERFGEDALQLQMGLAMTALAQVVGDITCETIFPELKESEDEKIRKEIIQSIQDNMCVIHKDKCLAWLEKQGNNNSISPEEMNKSIGRSIALSLINYLDDNRYEGAMNMSSIECEELENSILDSDWGKVYRYMRKKLEKQVSKKPTDKVEPKFKKE